jgi:cytochrome c-type biogenesis protein CcmH/NrfG
MASAAGQKPMILTAAEADLKRAEARARLAENQIKEPVARSNRPLVYSVAALLLIGVGYLVFNGIFPTVSETVPSPDINSTVAPPPADAPAASP